MKTNKLYGMTTLIALLLASLLSLCSCGKECKCNGDCHGTQCSAPCADDCKCTQKVIYNIIGKWKSSWDNGYAILTFKSDGSGTFAEAYGNNVDNATFYYKYDDESCLLTLITNGKEPYEIELMWINSNTFYVSDTGLVDENIETVWNRQ